ncbi:hypothetical protein COLO4_33490 [Corchorus olitorius]|uniref:Uncharacterized protein n=1 Tax=Corchorus olitorius TaxID=93759 RepID=A0A1R3GTA0_9ROSI|nr:hypothetical protein COLO4_33490 [Corchorus olitorius]
MSRKSWSVEILLLLLGLCQSISNANGFKQSAEDSNIRCIEKERHTLLQLRQSLVDDSGRLSSWGSKDCCLWKGVECSNRTNHVIMLDLGNHLSFDDGFDAYDSNQLRGKINPSLFQLQDLRYLDLSGNDFRGGSFPNINGSSLSKLRYLNLQSSGLSSAILYQFGNLSKLQFLDLSSNPYRVSYLYWVQNLSSLRFLNLSFSYLNDAKDWPQLLKLPYLEDLKLTSCSLPKIVSPPVLSLTNSTSSSPISIDLSHNNLTSSMYPLFFNITSKIVDLNLEDNLLEGSIPDFFRNMVSLEHLDLSHNKLGEEIPEFLGNICTLKTLDLSVNYFSRFVPGLSGCIQNSLEILTLFMNPFHDSSILSHVTRFSSLRELDLMYNNLNGSFPSSFRRPSKLTSLNLAGNQLTGSLPDLSKLSSLEYLDISYNRFNGTVTESLGSLSELKQLYASWNSLEGVISEAHFVNLSKLQTLDLSYNLLLFNVSKKWIPPFQLSYISLSFCNLGPHFPKWVQTQKEFHDLDISGAGISGSIPDWFWDLPPYLSSLNLSYNHLTGMLPDLSLRIKAVTGIDLSSNMFEGPLPIFSYNVTSLILSKNRFSGSVSPLCNITAGVLSILDLSDNLLSGELPDCFFHWKDLIVLNLANNNFSGGIPETVGSLLSLETINLHNNSFSGDLPSSLKNCSKLKFLDLSENTFSGRVPAWIGESLSSLIFLSLQANEFNGRIPAKLCLLANLRILDLSQNSLSGKIPLCLHNLTAMIQNGDSYGIIEYFYLASMQNNSFRVGTYVERAWVEWKGNKYQYEKSLGFFRIIDLAGNKLVGEIPDVITRLSELVVLNLSGNSLMGFIPENIGQLKQLQSLDLSNNQLSGQIPDSMSDLNFLSYLNLSYNNLSGKIPMGTQIQTIGASAFVGNQALCGPPIARQCPKMLHDQQPDGHNNKEDIDEFGKWLYAGMGIGFLMAFWGVCGTLLLKPSWRHAYFLLLDKWKDSLYVTFILWGARLEKKFKSLKIQSSWKAQ